MSASSSAIDTSVSVPLILTTHPSHSAVAQWVGGKALHLCGHAAVETYSVLTRLPMGVRLGALETAQFLDELFAGVLVMPEHLAASAYRELAHCGIEGGAAYDGLIGLVARAHDAVLLTRDRRARGTYEALGVKLRFLDIP